MPEAHAEFLEADALTGKRPFDELNEGEGQHAVNDAAPISRLACDVLVHVKGVEITGEAREGLHHRLGAGEADDRHQL